MSRFCLVAAAAAAIAVLHSAAAPDPGPGADAAAAADADADADADALVRRACAAVLRCSVRDTDLPHRASLVMETFWAVRNLVPSLGPAPAAWPDRLGAGVTFWCFKRFRLGLRAAQSSTDRVNKALDLMQPVRYDAASAPWAASAAVASAAAPSSAASAGPVQAATAASDPLQDVDWSLFMDDFGWGGNDGVLLGLL